MRQSRSTFRPLFSTNSWPFGSVVALKPFATKGRAAWDARIEKLGNVFQHEAAATSGLRRACKRPALAADAEADTGALPFLYTSPIPYTYTLFARVEDGDTGCFTTAVLTVNLNDAPGVFTPTPLEYCDTDNNPNDRKQACR